MITFDKHDFRLEVQPDGLRAALFEGRHLAYVVVLQEDTVEGFSVYGANKIYDRIATKCCNKFNEFVNLLVDHLKAYRQDYLKVEDLKRAFELAYNK